ncbi:hypothetical protein DDE18_14935 [Nocardioides gansuensis]|uniref:Major facilitator superfamily (MFS) profile domain-containing protein n=1 Tax=Nocardioides gansuensis TaxID=2138300 RepID=A0A2T8F8J4_9ACTN|nr:hypothetical protein DDE18_14935 [Nocardioides gansuensis]
MLAGVVALQLVAETALTPYWPLLFRELFGMHELAATGSYLSVCRFAGLLAMPLWGLLALRLPARSLIVAGLLGSAVFDLALALAPTWWTFTACSAGVVACGSSLVLAYPALVSVVEQDGRRDRRSAVVLFWAVFHVAAVGSTLVGAAVVGMEQPRWGLGAFAVVDLLLAALVWARVERRPAVETAAPAEQPAVAATTAPSRRSLLLLVVAVVAADAAIAVARPFFVELLVAGGTSVEVAGWMFLLPAVGSLAVLPVASRLLDRPGVALVPACALIAAAAYLVQAATSDHLLALAAGRLLLGAATGVLLVALDLAVFAQVGTAGPAFTAVETGRSAALLAAPLLATVLAGPSLGGPLLGSALLVVVSGVLLALHGRRTRVPSVPPTPQEPLHVVDPVA